MWDSRRGPTVESETRVSSAWRLILRSVARVIIGVIVVVAAWQLAIVLLQPPAYLLPPPCTVLTAIVTQYTTLAANTWATTWETLLGFAIALLGGIAGAVLLSLS